MNKYITVKILRYIWEVTCWPSTHLPETVVKITGILVCCHSFFHSILLRFLATESVDVLLFHGSSPHSFQRLSEEETENHGVFFSCYNINHLTLSGHSPSLTRKLYTPICWISFLPFFIENNPYFKNRLSWLTLPFFFTFWHMYKQLSDPRQLS